MTNAAIDQYLARALASVVHAQPPDPFPEALSGDLAAIARRIAFHGIALLFARAPDLLSGWPQPIAHAVREQAGVQVFWEQSHHPAVARLLEALAAQGIRAVVTKGTALAYSLYDDPALRRRGDTDIYVPDAPQDAVRQIMQGCGFHPEGDIKALQESWTADSVIGFRPAVDMHWRINASAAISQLLETGLRFDQTIALERLSPHARGAGPVDNLILIAINRGAHGTFGYMSGTETLFETDRLAWALDAHLLASGMSAQDWQALADRALHTGTAKVVEGLLDFAVRTFGTRIPETFSAALIAAPTDCGFSAYFGSTSHLARLRQDVAAGRGLAEKVQVLRYATLPSDEFLKARYPDAHHWPRPALHLRRILGGAVKFVTGRI